LNNLKKANENELNFFNRLSNALFGQIKPDQSKDYNNLEEVLKNLNEMIYRLDLSNQKQIPLIGQKFTNLAI
jgi:hypothetical protein